MNDMISKLFGSDYIDTVILPKVDEFEEFAKLNKYKRSIICYDITDLKLIAPNIYNNGKVMEILGVVEKENIEEVSSIILERIIELLVIEKSINDFIKDPIKLINDVLNYLTSIGICSDTKELNEEELEFMMYYIKLVVNFINKIIRDDFDNYVNIIDTADFYMEYDTNDRYYYVLSIDSDVRLDYMYLVIRRYVREQNGI